MSRYTSPTGIARPRERPSAPPITENEAEYIVGVLEIGEEVDDYEFDLALGHRYWTTNLNVLTIGHDGRITYTAADGTPIDSAPISAARLIVTRETIDIRRPGHRGEIMRRNPAPR